MIIALHLSGYGFMSVLIFRARGRWYLQRLLRENELLFLLSYPLLEKLGVSKAAIIDRGWACCPFVGSCVCFTSEGVICKRIFLLILTPGCNTSVVIWELYHCSFYYHILYWRNLVYQRRPLSIEDGHAVHLLAVVFVLRQRALGVICKRNPDFKMVESRIPK